MDMSSDVSEINHWRLRTTDLYCSFLPESRVFITAHFLIHGCHHYLPMDQQRLVMPPSLAAMNGILLHYFITRIFWWEEGINMAVLSGLGLGYIYYEVLHYYLHVAGTYVLSLFLP